MRAFGNFGNHADPDEDFHKTEQGRKKFFAAMNEDNAHGAKRDVGDARDKHQTVTRLSDIVQLT